MSARRHVPEGRPQALGPPPGDTPRAGGGALAPLVNKMAKFIPKRRDRKLHTGLFGYARSLDGVTLPRATHRRLPTG